MIWFGCFCTLLVYYGWFVLFGCGLDDLVSFQLIDLFAYFFVNAYGLDGFLALRVCFAYTVNIFAMYSELPGFFSVWLKFIYTLTQSGKNRFL